MGGYLRDTTLGEESVDIDIVVEGDAIKAAHQLHRLLSGKIFRHKEFGSASIVTDYGERVDLTSARTETYATPAELPKVLPSNIQADLKRRDFTINTICMSLSRKNLGEIFDPYNGLADIKTRTIRILHRNSFIDDPTRIFRALRYKNRFRFRLERETENSLKEAVTREMIGQLTGQRLLNELKLIFEEDNYLDVIRNLSKYKIKSISKRELKILSLTGSAKFYFYLAKFTINKMPLKKEELKLIAEMRKLKDIVRNLSRARKNSQIYNTLYPLCAQTLDIISALKPRLRSKIDRYPALKNTKPFVTGADLIKSGLEPGPKFKKFLKAVFELQLDNKITSKSQAFRELKNVG